ncbi:MAG TPA: CHRD domain-containing protein [Ignavibacteriaceae bacterium]|nr:CHRD domain-containing protein [Ignavibacteriaceae bacterium]
MFTAKLDGSQEAPNPVSTPATGTAWAVLGPDMTTLTFHLTYAQLDSTFTNAHFHLGAAGVGGGVIHGIASDFVGNTASGVWTDIPDSILTKLFKQEIYLNIHSAKHPGGEIRGQLIPVDDGIGFTAALDGSQEAPNPVTTNATGTGWAVLRDDGSEIEYSVTIAGLSSNLTMAHFHYGAAGVGGPVVQPITFTDSTSTGSWTGFADSIISSILLDELYFNVHSTNHGPGEIRGQLIHQGEIMFNAKLEGTNETPNPVTTDANGTAWAVLSGDKSTLYYNVTYAQLDSPFTMAHLHLAP